MRTVTFAALVTVLAVGGCTSAAVGRPASHPAGTPTASPAAGQSAQPAALAAAPSAFGSRPPRRVTPGAGGHRLAAICPQVSAALAASKLRTLVRDKVYAEYGIAAGLQHRYRIDHLIPVELDGTDAVRNLWPQLLRASRAKDRLASTLHSMVCAGQLSLAQAQRSIRTNWLRAYHLYVTVRPGSGRPAPSPPPAPLPLPSPSPTLSAASCHPIASSGNCYEPGEFCSNADHGVTGVAGDGKTIRCEDNDGWRWEPV